MNGSTISYLMMAAPQGEGAQQGPMPMLIMMALIFGIFYFMMIRPQQRRERERRAMIAALRAGQKVLFGGGFVGTIVEARESTFVIRIAENVDVEVARGAVTRVLNEGETVSSDNP